MEMPCRWLDFGVWRQVLDGVSIFIIRAFGIGDCLFYQEGTWNADHLLYHKVFVLESALNFPSYFYLFSVPICYLKAS